MAEAIVSIAVQTIADLLSAEVRFLSNVRGQVELLQTDLRQMQSFLKDAENKQEGNERLRNWVAEIRGIAYDAEDVIQTFVLKFASQSLGNSIPKRFISRFTKAPNLHQIGMEIKSLRDRAEVISKGMQTLGIISFSGEGERIHSENVTQQLLRRSYPHDEEEDIIISQKCIGDLMAQLLTDDEDRLRVVSIVGMGGLGKTTLAKKVYNNVEVRRHFDRLFWAFISQQFSMRDVLLEILKQLSVPREERAKWENMKTEELVLTLYQTLQSKLYLIVLDDIWSYKAWNSLKHAFPNGKKGSKVLFTTRADPLSSPIEPSFLTHEESWSLFCKKAFLKHVPQEMEKLGKEMVKKCGGLPLAIVVLGGLMAAKKSQYEWEVVLRSINSQFAKLEKQKQYSGVYGILALSYQALPWYLKPCFLYLSQFPEDWEIQKTMLIRLWIAEGFISQSSSIHCGDETLEDVGEQYLLELINRCMVQVNRRDHTGIGVKTCRMHDLMRDMCQSKAREENFLGFVEHPIGFFGIINDSSSSGIWQKSRRTVVYCKSLGRYPRRFDHEAKPEGNTSHLRSLLFFVDQQSMYTTQRHEYCFLFKNFRLLRVLNLRNIHVRDGKLPREIGVLIYLRYLGLRNCRINQVPASIGNLQSLCTLDLRELLRHARQIPNVLWKLRCLRHLLLPGLEESFFKPCRMDTLKHLETLKTIDAKVLIRKNAVNKLTNLRRLGIIFESTEEVEEVLNSVIFRNGQLRSLNTRDSKVDRVSYPNLEAFSKCQNLTRLKLWGAIVEDVPDSRCCIILNICEQFFPNYH